MEENFDEIEIDQSVKHLANFAQVVAKNDIKSKFQGRPARFDHYPKFNLDGSYKEKSKILVNDTPSLEVIQERKSRPNRISQFQNQNKKQNKNVKAKSNYRKRVFQVEKQKRMIDQIEERYKS